MRHQVATCVQAHIQNNGAGALMYIMCSQSVLPFSLIFYYLLVQLFQDNFVIIFS